MKEWFKSKDFDYFGKFFACGLRTWNYRGGFGISWEANQGFRLCIHIGPMKLWAGWFKFN